MIKTTYYTISLLIIFFTNGYAQNYKLLVGTYTKTNKSEGIYVYDFDSNTAKTTLLNVIKGLKNPSYLALNTKNNAVYSVNEYGTQSAVSAFKFNSHTGEANLLNKEATDGADPCFILADRKWVITANYTGGNINVFRLKADEKLSAVQQTIQHKGSGPDKRQTSAHVHQVSLSPDKKYLLATDLGDDRIYVYRYRPNRSKPLSLVHSVKTNPGSGPRHLTFSPNGKFVYLVHEFNGMISIFSYKGGNLTLLQELSTVVNGFQGRIDAADIHVSADGKFLYETNRGDANTISVFSIKDNGSLEHVETQNTLGRGPRNFVISPNGKYVLVAHQYTHNIVVFNRDTTTGKLSDSGNRILVDSPVCLVFTGE